MSVCVGRFHLFQRKQTTGTFYYYWFEENGKRVQRACGHGCSNKREAVAFLEELLKEELTETKKINDLSKTTFLTYAKDMFIEGAPHLNRWAAKGRILTRQTIAQYRRLLTYYLLPRFGHLTFQEIKPTALEDYLLELPLSNSYRNTIMYTLKLVMREARRAGVIEIIPELEPFKRNGRRQDTLSGQELAALFPYDYDELIRVWSRPKHMKKEPDAIPLMFGTIFCLTVSAGLRSGEARAIHRDQICESRSGLIIDRALDDRGVIGGLKKATTEDPRSRAVIIPEITMRMLTRWLSIAPEADNYPGLVFPYHDKPLASDFFLSRFRYGLDNIGIDYTTRRLTIHCLRYTYNTRMRTLLSEQVLRDFVGHRSIAMTDHYDNPILLERLTAYQDLKPSVEKFWG
ncbi:MAG TPA: site-specific integrase [Treponemataceae bacterium]|nr:site-specific integrase [Treponemataceae bacterium]